MKGDGDCDANSEENKPDRAEITDDDNFKCAICNLDLKMFALTQNTSLPRFIEMESHNFRSISVYDEFRCQTYLPFLSIIQTRYMYMYVWYTNTCNAK
jgi:hypothetical protein